MTSKLIRNIGISAMLIGSGLATKGCADDFNYEDKMIRQGKQEYFEEKGAFKDRNNAYEFVAGLGLAIGGLYLTGKRKNKDSNNYSTDQQLI